MSRNKKRLVIGIVAVAVVVALVLAYRTYLSPTRIAFVNFEDFSVAGISEAGNGLWVSVERFEAAEICAKNLADYDVIFFNAHGLRLSEEERGRLTEAASEGVVFHTVGATDPNSEITNLTGDDLKSVNSYFRFGGRANERSLLAYARRNLDGKTLFAGEIAAPVETPMEGYFHLGENDLFKTLADYEKFYASRRKEGAPRIALFTVNMGPKNPYTRQTYDMMIRTLEEKGFNVYPVFGARKALDYLRAIKPDLVILSAHGRFAPGLPEETIAALKELDVPVLCPVHVHQLYEDWMKDQRGMDGGMLSQSITMPELDGGIAPYVVSTLKRNEQGLKVVAPIESRVRHFCERVAMQLALRTKPNSEKRIAVFYYKTAGRNAMVASSLEIAPSLLNLLRRLKAEGYTTGELPATVDELVARIQKEGPALGTYAEGSFEEFLKTGDPELVTAGMLKAWIDRNIEPARRADLVRDHGELPGQRMVSRRDTEPAIAVARVRFGNIVLMPVPVAGEGSDMFKLVHDLRKAPSYPYIAAYLWVREGFHADAVSHFGTHGSVEFLPWKQAGLSPEDWPDALIGNTPHVYLYDVEDPGEAIMAKRRTYATMVSHLTAPFMRAGIDREKEELHRKIHSFKYDDLPPGLKETYRATITQMAVRMNLHRDLSLDTPVSGVFDDTAIEKLNQYTHELEFSKVPRGRYVLGRPYTEPEVIETVRLICADRIVDAMMKLDLLNGKITSRQYEDRHTLERYLGPAEKIVNQLLDRRSAPSQFINASDLARLEAWDSQASIMRQRPGMAGGSMSMMARRDTTSSVPRDKVATAMLPTYSRDLLALFRPGASADASRDSLVARSEHLQFYLDHAYIAAELEAKGQDGKAIAAILKSEEARGKIERAIQEARSAIQNIDSQEEEYVRAVRVLKDALWGVERYHRFLQISTEDELASMMRAYRGGYVAPSIGGDAIFNPEVLPTGRNLVGIDPERTPSKEAYKLGVELAEKVIEERIAKTGAYPRKIAMTFWSSDFFRDQGIQLAQLFHFLGVEPVYNAFGQVKDVRLIPAEKLGRPRIDVVVQTSGQFRDIAASRIYLINRAVRLASEANDPPEFVNNVREGSVAAEAMMKAKGVSPAEAREFSGIRVFGGVNGVYGTNIMPMVENGDRWDTDAELAQTYLNNMGAMYDEKHWSEFNPFAFEAAIQNTEMILHPRSSYVYGPLNLDHVYEFMGGFSSAIRQVTGRDPDAYFNDMRNPNRLRVQSAKEAIWVEARTTILNPEWIKEQQQEGATAAEEIAEITRDMYGWDVLKPAEIDDELWQEHYEVYVKDKLGLGMKDYFAQKNPYALQEITAVMLETIRKGRWNASEATRREIANMHVELVNEHKAGCSGFVCDNAKLREFIAGMVPADAGAAYQLQIATVRTAQGGPGGQRAGEQQTGQVLKKEEMSIASVTEFVKRNRVAVGTLAALVLVIGGAVVLGAVRSGRRG
jgi:cobaltochelatase CobN